DANSFAETFWEDKLMPFIGGNSEANEALARSGVAAGSELIYRCPADPSVRQPFVLPDGSVDGIAHRTSYLMNSLLSHKTRPYGPWSQLRCLGEAGSAIFIASPEPNGAAFAPANGGAPRQDDYDIWLGTNPIQPWIAWNRHSPTANYLYFDGHVA